ncbi:hypothetical protein BC941DRAFT_477536 [Chlamydoabsidia padenii]|nr:hypothetical protein BC941DRAFT_477536 [Chlamydoabsidia padenii]
MGIFSKRQPSTASFQDASRNSTDFMAIYGNDDADSINIAMTNLQVSKAPQVSEAPIESTTDKVIKKRRRYSEKEIIDVLVAYYVDGETLQEAGGRVGMSKSTASRLMKRYGDQLLPQVKRQKKATTIPTIGDEDLRKIRQMQLEKQKNS